MSVLVKIADNHQFSHTLTQLESMANGVILNKENEIRLTLSCIIAGGHLLVEDNPGMGKTTLIKVLAKLLGLNFNRIQFTNDLLPGDIIGNSIYDQNDKRFVFFPGPIFSQLVLADEINRATPKTQSACLQAMEEYQVSVDGQTHPLPRPFFLIATQNPRQSIGTFALPESQLDRFLMKIHLGYPNRAAEKELLMGDSRQKMIDHLKPVTSTDEILAMQESARDVQVSDSVIEYLQNIVDKTRAKFQGLSPRAVLGVLAAAKAWAFIEGRTFVIPEDIQAVAVATMSHRLSTTDDPHGINSRHRVNDVLKSVPVL